MCQNCDMLIRASKDFLNAEDAVSRTQRRVPELVSAKEKTIDLLAEAILTVEGWPKRMRKITNRTREEANV